MGGQRLEALAVLRDDLRSTAPNGNYQQVPDSMFLEILEHFRWVVGTSIDWIVEGGDLCQVVDRIANLRTPRPTQYQQDERWARFITMTATNSHYSAQQFLAERQYDYAAALNDWARIGKVPFVLPPPPPPKKGKDQPSAQAIRGLRVVIANHEAEDANGQPVQPLDGTPAGDEAVRRKRQVDGDDVPAGLRENEGDPLLPDEDEPLPGEDVRPTYENTGSRGFIINPDSSPPILGLRDPTKFHIERIIHGKYTALSSSLTNTMDWNDRRHIYALRKWRNEEYVKMTRDLKRPAAVPFHRVEIDFLYFEEARHYEHAYRRRMRRIARAHPTMTEQAIHNHIERWGFRYKISNGYQTRITKRFNKKFAGKTVVNGVTFDEPRPERSNNSLNQQRHRSRMLCRDFNVSYQPARGSRILPAGRTDDEDSDYQNGTRQPKPWVQPPADSDDTVDGNESSDPDSSDEEGEGNDGSDGGDDDDNDDGGDSLFLPERSSRRVTRQSQREDTTGGAGASTAVTGTGDGVDEADGSVASNTDEEYVAEDEEGSGEEYEGGGDHEGEADD